MEGESSREKNTAETSDGGTKYCKMEIFTPESHFRALQKALQDADAGHIGAYDSCIAYSRVTGTWRPLAGTHPYIGEEGKVSEEPEIKVEVTVKLSEVERVMDAVKAVHPYEEPLINVLPLIDVGIGAK